MESRLVVQERGLVRILVLVRERVLVLVRVVVQVRVRGPVPVLVLVVVLVRERGLVPVPVLVPDPAQVQASGSVLVPVLVLDPAQVPVLDPAQELGSAEGPAQVLAPQDLAVGRQDVLGIAGFCLAEVGAASGRRLGRADWP